MALSICPKSLENSKLALVCYSDELRGWVSSNKPNSESCTATSPYHPLELTGNFLVTVRGTHSSPLTLKHETERVKYATPRSSEALKNLRYT